MYKEIQPSAGLLGIVDSFWIFSHNQTRESFKILPDACVDILFDLSQGKAFFSGVMTHYQVRELGTEAELIGVRFKAEKFALLSTVSPKETQNQRVEFASIFPHHGSHTLCELHELSSLSKRITFLEKFLFKELKGLSKKEDALILAIIAEIRASKGIVSIHQLAKQMGISLRQLQRRFKDYVGLTIKEFARITRFHFAQQLISSAPHRNLLAIAFEMGFFDHAHMNYEFQRISGDLPSSFR